MTITHRKSTPIPSLTQAQLDAAITAGQYPAGTTLAQVILSADWNDEHNFDLSIADITGLQTQLTALSNGLSGKADASHTHTIAQISNLQTTLTALQNDINAKANATHSHVISDVTGLQTELTNLANALAGKADASHTHTIAQISNLQTTLTALQNDINSKANSTHSHVISDVTGLQTALDGKQPSGSYLVASDIANMLETGDIGVSVQEYDADTAKIDQAQTWVAQGQRIGTTANGGLTIASNTITLNLGAFNAFDLGTLAAGAYTLANPTGLAAGVSYKGDIKYTTPATGAVTFAYGSAWDFDGGTAPSAPTANNATVFFDYASHSASNVRLTAPKAWS